MAALAVVLPAGGLGVVVVVVVGVVDAGAADEVVAGLLNSEVAAGAVVVVGFAPNVRGEASPAF